MCDSLNMTTTELKTAQELAWYLGEHLEATETLAQRHGNPLPICHVHAKRALADWYRVTNTDTSKGAAK
jgi:hypothetical protein